jgi:hypothetical protein
MSQTVIVGNQAYKKRNVVGVWLGLPFVTLGIYSYVDIQGQRRGAKVPDGRFDQAHVVSPRLLPRSNTDRPAVRCHLPTWEANRENGGGER